jgi:hypothetical protein
MCKYSVATRTILLARGYVGGRQRIYSGKLIPISKAAREFCRTERTSTTNKSYCIQRKSRTKCDAHAMLKQLEGLTARRSKADMLSVALRSMAALKASPFPAQPNDVEWADLQDASLLRGSYLHIAGAGKSPEASGCLCSPQPNTLKLSSRPEHLRECWSFDFNTASPQVDSTESGALTAFHTDN